MCVNLLANRYVRTVIQAEKPRQARISRFSGRKTKASAGAFCPLVPFIEGDKLSPRLVTDDDVPDTCISRAEV